MNKKHLFLKGRTYGWLLAASVTLLGACTDAIEPETFHPGVSNTTLGTPEITAVASADGKSTILSWPVLMGAGGFQMSLYKLAGNTEIAIVTDTIIDGSTCEFPREDDTNYKLLVQTLGNEKYNNKGSEQIEFLFSSLVPKIHDEAIPAGTDLFQWFNEHQAVISAATEEYAIELTCGTTYKLSDKIEIGNLPFTLRSSDKTGTAPVIEMEGTAAIVTESGIKIKNVDFDCTNMTDANSAVIMFSKNHSYDKTKNHYLIGDGYPVVLQNCNIKNVSTRLIWDQKEPYVLDNLLIEDCVIGLDQVAQKGKNTHAIELSNSFPMNFTVQRSTIYSTTEVKDKGKAYFVAYMNERPQNLVNGLYPACYINWYNNTMVNVNKGSKAGDGSSFANWGRLKGQKVANVDVKNNIFLNCSGDRVVRQSFLQGQNGGMIHNFENNLYWYNGGASTADWDKGDRKVNEDPQLTQNAEGIFVVGNSAAAAANLGDPRGLQ